MHLIGCEQICHRSVAVIIDIKFCETGTWSVRGQFHSVNEYLSFHLYSLVLLIFFSTVFHPRLLTSHFWFIFQQLILIHLVHQKKYENSPCHHLHLKMYQMLNTASFYETIKSPSSLTSHWIMFLIENVHFNGLSANLYFWRFHGTQPRFLIKMILILIQTQTTIIKKTWVWVS